MLVDWKDAHAMFKDTRIFLFYSFVFLAFSFSFLFRVKTFSSERLVVCIILSMRFSFIDWFFSNKKIEPKMKCKKNRYTGIRIHRYTLGVKRGSIEYRFLFFSTRRICLWLVDWFFLTTPPQCSTDLYPILFLTLDLDGVTVIFRQII